MYTYMHPAIVIVLYGGYKSRALHIFIWMVIFYGESACILCIYYNKIHDKKMTEIYKSNSKSFANDAYQQI